MSDGFWDLTPSERGAAYEWAEREFGGSFHDLTPEERGAGYDWGVERFGGGGYGE